jgi:hypothetical protein
VRTRKSGSMQVADAEPAERREPIDYAYRLAEQCGNPVWCQDEAGPYQAIPQPGASWAPRGNPHRQPHENVWGGTVKLLTLFPVMCGMAH